MLRFLPDTIRDAILRPLAMAASNGWIYTEITAPDFRFLLAIFFAAIAAAYFFRSHLKKNEAIERNRPTWILFAFIVISFAPWLLTTGNGRYFLPILIFIGPATVGLIQLWPGTRGMKLSLASLSLFIQANALLVNHPWHGFDTWEWIPWDKAPYIDLEMDRSLIDPNATYITLSGVSYSLAAPQFPESSKWIGIGEAPAPAPGSSNPRALLLRNRLEQAQSLKIFQRAAVREMQPNSVQPTATAIAALNQVLGGHYMALKEPTDCILVRSKKLQAITLTSSDESKTRKSEILDKTGFWICSLNFPVQPRPSPPPTEESIQASWAFSRMESLCPRFFQKGQTGVEEHPAGHMRNYGGSESSLIATRSGEIYLKYGRALNPQRLASYNDLQNPHFAINCNSFIGRSGLPWEREI